MPKPHKEPPRLIEALEHIKAAGNLLPMRDVTVPQLDRLWDFIDDNDLAKMDFSGKWHLTDTGNALIEKSRVAS